MNEKLKFSWGHIIAFLALIFISYVTFMGITYLTDGDFFIASFGMFCVDILLFFFFIGGQILKGTERKFSTKIVIERICIFGSPVVFVIAMIPFAHFWTVCSQNDEIVEKFSSSITTSQKMFSDYDKYVDTRIANYKELITYNLYNKVASPHEYSEFGFNGKNDEIQQSNMIKALRLQLGSENYDNLRNISTQWIDRASLGTSVWNIFLLGNIKEIKSSIQNWHNILVGFTLKKLSNEEYNGYNSVVAFDADGETIVTALNGLDELNELYTARQSLHITTILICVLCYFMLLLPYFIQDRHTKSTYRLFGKRKISRESFLEINNAQKSSSKHHETTYKRNEDNDDDCGPFTL